MRYEDKVRARGGPARRGRGFSLVEVLLAIFILGIGMIMVASVFPVGANWTRQTTEESLAQSIAQNGFTVIQTYYGPGGVLSGALTPANLQDNQAANSDPTMGYAFGLQALPGFANIPVAMRSYQFGSTAPFPANNPQACTYFWTALCRVSPNASHNGTPFKMSATYNYDIYILVFRKGSAEHTFSDFTSAGPEIKGLRNFVPPAPASPEYFVPTLYRALYNVGQFDANATPNIKGAVPAIGGMGIGAISGTVFTQRHNGNLVNPQAQARPGIAYLDPVNNVLEPIIYSPPADNTQASPLIYVYQTTLSL